MITEDYVSFEIAKLLQEKGFHEKVNHVYHYYTSAPFYRRHLRDFNGEDYKNLRHEHYSVPTLQMAMKWLREVHNIGIFPSTYTHIVDRKTVHSYGTAIINLKTYKLMTDNYLSNDTYEDAVETAIKYCLENLI